MTRGSAEMRRWRDARAARRAAADRLAVAECAAGERRRWSTGFRIGLAVIAVLALVGAGAAVWSAVDRASRYTDAQLVDAAAQRVELLLTANADDRQRAREILDGATGEFHDTFAQSAQAYTRFVERAGSSGSARIDGAALASRAGDRGVVLVAASVRVAADPAKAGEPSPTPAAGPVAVEHRQLRLRVVMVPEDGALKLAGVVFLP
ncbi:hypothetical protein MYK68_17400 [Gordonia sp. PP30]|uniref:hypothetical protein n=1 Tax=Gordonia sp. PP30 TaxID=2935861 RepID=UPI001FFFFC0F|nr:hypothetical protein [Gordonia sp. PP30]UQE74475.1 hypothetical protein MYK68_17400 [Gordonia sp. PP30]